jgi:hypothetical protein
MLFHNSLLIQIADITLLLGSNDPGLRLIPEETAEGFVVHGKDPDITVEAQLNDLSHLEITGRPTFDSGASWRLYQKNGTHTFLFQSHGLGSTPYKMAKIRNDFTSGEVLLHRPYLTSSRGIYPLEYPLDELLFIHHLALGKGVETHACGMIDSRGNGHLFLGQSGAGKTTTARLWENEPGVTILSDDRVALRKMDGRLWIYGTPWHGEADFASPTRAPLSRVYFLEKGAQNESRTLGKTESVGRFTACSFLPFYSSEALDFTLAFFEDVATSVPCHELKFLPNREIVDFVKERSL